MFLFLAFQNDNSTRISRGKKHWLLSKTPLPFVQIFLHRRAEIIYLFINSINQWEGGASLESTS
jgi:hypothetical protein